MLLNEFLKEHRKVQEQEATIADLRFSHGAAAKGLRDGHGAAAEATSSPDCKFEGASLANPKSQRTD
jgi:hypothetical protein